MRIDTSSDKIDCWLVVRILVMLHSGKKKYIRRMSQLMKNTITKDKKSVFEEANDTFE